MSKSNAKSETLAAKESGVLTIEVVKQSLFENMTPLEMMLLMYRIESDLLCSSITDDDTMYRNEIKLFFMTMTKNVIGLKNNTNPNAINIPELICQ